MQGEALDTVMITLPLPPSSEWDEAMEARVQLLTVRVRVVTPRLVYSSCCWEDEWVTIDVVGVL
jgi:hypothetical protein